MCIYTHTYKCVCSPSPEKDARYPALSLSTLIPETGSLAEPRVKKEWQPASPSDFLSGQQHWGFWGECIRAVFFFMEAGNLNSSPHASEKVL